MIDYTAMFEALMSRLPEGIISDVLIYVMVLSFFGIAMYYTYIRILKEIEAVKEKRLSNMLLEQQVNQSLRLSIHSNVATRTPEADNTNSNINK